jgi:hypothetical protein
MGGLVAKMTAVTVSISTNFTSIQLMLPDNSIDRL